MEVPAEMGGAGRTAAQARFQGAEDDGMKEKRTWLCLSCGAGYEAHPDLLPLRCWECRARLVEMASGPTNEPRAQRQRPSSR
jgi:DNA-directed RNA polymerase subunit RPC12/RpoP